MAIDTDSPTGLTADEGGSHGHDDPVVIDDRPSGPRSDKTTIAAAIAAISGAVGFVWGMSWLLIGLDRDAAPLVIGAVATMVLGLASVAGAAALYQRVRWARGAVSAAFAVNSTAVVVFGAMSAVASGADPTPYLATAALLVVFASVVVLLQSAEARADFPDGDSSLGRTVALWSIVAVWTLPTFGLLLSSFRAERAVKTEGWWTIFTNPQLTLDNYSTVLGSGGGGDAPNMLQYFANSIAIVLPATVIPISIALFAAYAFAWMDFPGRKGLFIVVVSLMAVPLQMSLIPLLQLYTGGAHIGSFTIFPDLDLNGKALSVWLTHTGFGLPLAIFLLYNYVSGLPKDIFEAARIDGADHYTIFWRLVVPLSVPAIAAFGIFQFLWTWNDYLIALTFIGGNADAQPLTIRLAGLSGGRGQDWHVLTAAAFVTMSVPLAVFFSLQRFFVRGLLAGSVKG